VWITGQQTSLATAKMDTWATGFQQIFIHNKLGDRLFPLDNSVTEFFGDDWQRMRVKACLPVCLDCVELVTKFVGHVAKYVIDLSQSLLSPCL
jgi:hypothetical protein